MRGARFFKVYILGGKGLVVHEEKFDVLGVLDEESLVAVGHKVTGLLVGAVTNLQSNISPDTHDSDMIIRAAAAAIIAGQHSLQRSIDPSR